MKATESKTCPLQSTYRMDRRLDATVAGDPNSSRLPIQLGCEIAKEIKVLVPFTVPM